jgi:hypothetical protein
MIPFAIASTIAVGLAMAPMPYGYYLLLRIVLCVTAAVGWNSSRGSGDRVWPWTYGIATVLYNPVLPVKLGSKSLWMALNVATLVAFWLGALKLRSSGSEGLQSPLMRRGDPDRYDERVVGPAGRCLRCFTPRSDSRAYCLRCGKHEGWFETPDEAPSGRCAFHPTKRAARYCALCSRPVCADCIEREGRSFLMGVPTTQCKACIADMARIEEEFFAELGRTGKCAKHSEKDAFYRCLGCELPLCASCDYYIRRPPLWRRRGPYCLVCYRMACLGMDPAELARG